MIHANKYIHYLMFIIFFVMYSASATGAADDIINMLFRTSHVSVLKRDSLGRTPKDLAAKAQGKPRKKGEKK